MDDTRKQALLAKLHKLVEKRKKLLVQYILKCDSCGTALGGTTTVNKSSGMLCVNCAKEKHDREWTALRTKRAQLLVDLFSAFATMGKPA